MPDILIAASPVDHTVTQLVHLWGEKNEKEKQFEQEFEESKCLFIIILILIWQQIMKKKEFNSHLSSRECMF